MLLIRRHDADLTSIQARFIISPPSSALDRAGEKFRRGSPTMNTMQPFLGAFNITMAATPLCAVLAYLAMIVL